MYSSIILIFIRLTWFETFSMRSHKYFPHSCKNTINSFRNLKQCSKPDDDKLNNTLYMRLKFVNEILTHNN